MNQPKLSPRQRNFVLGTQRFIYWLSKHWLALANLFIFLYVGLPFAAPILMKAGWTGPARAIYTMYKPLCHQLAFRSWFLFGEQPVYPKAEYQDLFGLHDASFTELYTGAREFIGNETMGYKVALCQRDVATYAALLLGGLAYDRLRRRGLRAMPFLLFILLGILPIAIDGGTQFISLVFTSFPARESVWQLRTLTGAMFGFSIIWLAYPYVQEGMDETKQMLAERYGWNGHTKPPQPPTPTTRDRVVQLLEDKDEI
jgi:uncharacterized membrane protein